VRGCRNKSEGCRNCYAKAQAARIVRMGVGRPTPYDGIVRVVGGEPKWTGEVAFDAARLSMPLRWREPSTVFVDSMSDLFYDQRPNEHIAAVFGVMAAALPHTFLVLTKYAERMRQWFKWLENHVEQDATDRSGRDSMLEYLDETACGALDGHYNCCHLGLTTNAARAWPLPNVWLGVSVENQDAANERIPELLATPAALRFLSCEPLLGPVNLTLHGSQIKGWDEDWKYDTLAGVEWSRPSDSADKSGSSPELDWVIAGCESGPDARPCDTAWLRSLRDQCARADVPYFLKQGRDGGGAITAGPGSDRKVGGVIEIPYLDGTQHAAFPGVTL
jgi:protein gp37